MAQYKSEFVDIDPDVCPMDELKRTIDDLTDKSGFYETQQLAFKTFINSVYGACASKYFVGHNTAVAESITLQGQDLNHFSENSVNRYYRGIFQSDEEYNRIIFVPITEYVEKYPITPTTLVVKKGDNGEWEKAELPCTAEELSNESYGKEVKAKLKSIKVATKFGPYLGITAEQMKGIEIGKGRVTEQKPLVGDEFRYLEGEESMTVAGDTDSVIGSTLVYANGERMPIEELFTKLKYANHDTVLVVGDGKEVVPVKRTEDSQVTTLAYNPLAPFYPVERPINYVMRHKVSKAKYRIKSSDGREVIVTGDHSCMVWRDGEVIEVKACEIDPKRDRLVINDETVGAL